MAYSSSSSNANSKVHTCSTECEQSYAQLKKLYDTQREQLGDASIEIQAYTQALKKVEVNKSAIRKTLCQLSANDKAGFGHDGAKESKYCQLLLSTASTEDLVLLAFGESILGLVMNPSSIFLVSSSKKKYARRIVQLLRDDYNCCLWLWFCVWRQQFVFMVLFIDVNSRVSIDNDCPAKIGIYQGGKFAWHCEWNMLFDVGSNYISYSLFQPTKAIKKEEKLFVHESAHAVKHKEVSTVRVKIKELVLLFVVHTANACIVWLIQLWKLSYQFSDMECDMI
ncbi:hypothetical protein Tco_0968015 [Tanacetum coccineum]